MPKKPQTQKSGLKQENASLPIPPLLLTIDEEAFLTKSPLHLQPAS